LALSGFVAPHDSMSSIGSNLFNDREDLARSGLRRRPQVTASPSTTAAATARHQGQHHCQCASRSPGHPADSAVTIDDNIFDGNDTGVIVNDSDAPVVGDTIRDGNAGVVAMGGAAPVISGNTIDVEGRGITIGHGTDATGEGNTVCAGESSTYFADGADPQVSGNQISEASLSSSDALLLPTGPALETGPAYSYREPFGSEPPQTG
jgi:hypothetical protein